MKNKQPSRVSLFWDFVETHKKIIIIALLVAGLCLRLFYFIEMQQTPYGNFHYMESAFNDQWARSIAKGHFNQGETIFSPPLYPYLMGLVYFLTNNNSVIMKMLQFIMGLGSSWLIFLITRKIIDEKTALISLGLSLFYRMFFYFENQLIAVPLMILVSLGAFYLFLSALEKRGTCYWLGSGFLFGLAILAGTPILLFLFGAMLWLFFKLKNEGTWQQAVKYLFLILISLILPLLPVTIHNAVHGQAFVPVAVEDGFRFYAGNNALADGRTEILPWKNIKVPTDSMNLIEAGQEALNKSDTNNAELSAYWFGQGLDFIITQPLHALRLYAQKIFYFWNSDAIGNNIDIQFITEKSLVFHIFSFPYFILFLLALGGVVLAFWQKHDFFMIYLFILSIFVSTLPFVSNAETRISIMPLLIVLSAYFINQGPRLKELLLKKNSHKWVLGGAVILGGLFVFPFARMNDPGKNWSQKAYAYESQNNYIQAADSMKKALKYQPENKEAYLDLSQYYLKQLKNPEKSIDYLERLLEIDPKNLKAHYQLGLSYKALGQFNEARYFFQSTINLEKKKPAGSKKRILSTEANFQLGQIEEADINYDLAIEYYDEVIKLNPNHRKTLFYLGRLYYSMGLFFEARRFLTKALALDSDNKEASALLESMQGVF